MFRRKKGQKSKREKSFQTQPVHWNLSCLQQGAMCLLHREEKKHRLLQNMLPYQAQYGNRPLGRGLIPILQIQWGKPIEIYINYDSSKGILVMFFFRYNYLDNSTKDKKKSKERRRPNSASVHLSYFFISDKLYAVTSIKNLTFWCLDRVLFWSVQEVMVAQLNPVVNLEHPTVLLHLAIKILPLWPNL